MNLNTVNTIRKEFADALRSEDFITDKSGVDTLEIVGASFIADNKCIFGTVNEDYITKELAWYKSMSLNVNDIPGGAPEIWKQVADLQGCIHSNYGYRIWHRECFNQYKHCLAELKSNPNSRRAVMIYTEPSMHCDYNWNGMSDFICTNVVQYFIRNNRLYGVVQMRSNDVVFGYNNDYAWQMHVINELAKDLNVKMGHFPITWQVGSLHIYERHFYLVDHYTRTGDISISRKAYDALYPTSRWTAANIAARVAGKVHGDGKTNINME